MEKKVNSFIIQPRAKNRNLRKFDHMTLSESVREESPDRPGGTSFTVGEKISMSKKLNEIMDTERTIYMYVCEQVNEERERGGVCERDRERERKIEAGREKGRETGTERDRVRIGNRFRNEC